MEGVVERRLTRPDGRIVAWTESGVPEGRPVLRLPGMPGSRLSLRADRRPWTERGLRIIQTERPGYGASTRLPGRGFVEHADDLAAILDLVGIDAVLVYGGSGAAPHILALAARHPERVLAVTITDGVAPIEDDELEMLTPLNAAGVRLGHVGDEAGMRALLEPVRRATLADPLGGLRTMLETAPPDDRAILSDPTWQEGQIIGLREALAAGVDGWVDESLAVFGDWADVHPEGVGCSVTWWHTEGDRLVPLSAVRRLVARLPDARLVVWPELGHLAAHRHEPEVLDDLLARSGRVG